MFLFLLKLIALLILVNVVYRLVSIYLATLIFNSGKVLVDDGPFNTTKVCSNEALLIYIQKAQMEKAKEEVFGTNYKARGGGDNLFFRHSYGAMDYIVDSSNTHNTLMYYRIFKNANDNIRSLLYNYAAFVDAKNATPNLAYRPLICDPEDCIHPRIHRLSGVSLKHVFYSPRAMRFPFTFVRDPISRFISAVKEVGFGALMMSFLQSNI